ncbi:MAG: hypothetical protein IPM23_11945 [Candidatus Melainabacteria bacterium]|nr:hypothetical protein [Candidatus Melainabacteria bacterium]
MPKLTFKNTIEKEKKEQEKYKRQKYVRMRKLLGDLRTALKPNEEDDLAIDKSLVKLFNEHLPSGFLYETRVISNEPVTIKSGRNRVAELQ